MACTGYTSFIQEGTTKTATEFLKLCCRAMGVFYYLREEPLSPDIPKSIPLDLSSQQRELDKDKKALEDAKKMTDKEWADKLADNIASQTKSLTGYIQEEDEYTTRLKAIKAEIEKWKCDEKYDTLKTFAIGQIDMCLPSGRNWAQEALDELKTMTVEEYKKTHIEMLERAVQCDEESIETAKKNNKEANEYLSGFFNELNQLGGK